MKKIYMFLLVGAFYYGFGTFAADSAKNNIENRHNIIEAAIDAATE